MFQFKIIHNVVFTKDRLFKANVVQDDKCKENPETLLHLLFHCPLTVAFWNDFREWWLRNTQIELNLTPSKVLYGVIDNSKFCMLLNFALLVAKFCMYRCSLDDIPLFFPVFETELREKAGIEHDIAKENGYLKHFKIKMGTTDSQQIHCYLRDPLNHFPLLFRCWSDCRRCFLSLVSFRSAYLF